jgi:shikimate dehydrogenase
MSFIKAAVIGHPIHHSKSPIIHNHWIAEYKLQGEYKAIDIAPEYLKSGVQNLVDEGYAGFNVTIPHKQEIFKLCKEVDETAKSIGAVNTVVISEGKLFGTNTDAFGFIQNVKQEAFGVDFAHRPCVVLGAGGAARAIIHGLIGAGAQKIILTNRTIEKAQEVAAFNKDIVEVSAWEKRSSVLEDAGFLVNTTALGMKGKDPLEIDLSPLPRDATVSDIVYAPLMTDLLLQAKNNGHQIVTGIGMLLHQARPAFEKWFGVLPDVTPALEEKVLS